MYVKRVLAVSVGLVLLAALFGCGDNDTTPTNGGGSTTNGVLLGRVVNTLGNPIGDVTVRLLGAAATRQVGSATTNADGYFSLGSVTPGRQRVLFSAPNYSDKIEVVDVVAGQSLRVPITMIQAGTVQSVNGAQANTVTHNGGSVALPANSVVNAAGQPVDTFTVEVTTVPPSTDRYEDVFPGPFLGVPEGQGTSTAIRSYGYIDVQLRDAQGNELQLATGTTAELVIPIDPANDPGTATVPLWYFSASQGIWVQEGVATRDNANNVYRANVSHFTPWNLDVPIDEQSTKRVILRLEGQPLVGVSVRVVGSGWQAQAATDANGVATLTVAAGEAADIFVANADAEWQLVENGETMPAAGQTLDNTFNFTAADNIASARMVFVLRWGETPRDLDSHLTIPTTPDRSHVYYSQRGSLTASPYAELDTDDTSSFGPEIITVTRALQGTYRYCVNNFSGQAAGGIEDSGAEVTLILADGRTFVASVPTTNTADGRIWCVFDVTVDASGNVTQVTPLNTFSNDTSVLLAGNSRMVTTK